MTRWIVAVAACLTIAGMAAQAHHSIAGVYDDSREETVDGVVTQFQFVSPHPFVEVTHGRTAQPWRLEMDNRRELTAIGFAADTLKPGDRIVVTGSLARREANRMYISRLRRPADGFVRTGWWHAAAPDAAALTGISEPAGSFALGLRETGDIFPGGKTPCGVRRGIGRV